MRVSQSSLITPIGSITEIRMGATLRGRDATRLDPKGTCRMIRIGDISNEGVLITNDLLQFEPKESIKEDLFLRPGDVLFPNRGTRTTALAFERTETNVLAGGQFFVLKPDTRRVLPAYLAWFLRSEIAAKHFQLRRKGTLVQTVQRHDIADLSIPLPSFVTQEKIVALDVLATEERQISERLSRLKSMHLHRRLIAAASKSHFTA